MSIQNHIDMIKNAGRFAFAQPVSTRTAEIMEEMLKVIEKGKYLSAEVHEAWDEERISIDTFDASIAYDISIAALEKKYG